MKRQLTSFVLLLFIILAIMPIPAAGAADGEWSPRDTTLETQEFSGSFPRCASPITSYLTQNPDGSMTSVEVSEPDELVTVETNDIFGLRLLYVELPFELPLFGAYYSGERYNYLVFGQNDIEESGSVEVIRIIKYDKSFTRLGSVSITGEMIQTRIPFRSGCPRMAENENTLILYTSRTRYMSEDGNVHQSNLAIMIDTGDMAVSYTSPFYPQNYISHSFNQYILYDNGVPVYLDHGDAYPRSVVLQKGDQISDATFPSLPKATMYAIPGAIGANQTGVAVGGLVMSNSSYLTAIATIDHNRVTEYTDYEMIGLGTDQRDIIVCAVPKDYADGAIAEQIIVGKYIGTANIASTPRLISNGDNSFTVLWQEFSLDYIPGSYVALVIDSSGRPIRESRRYTDINDFYGEFFGIAAVPADLESIDTAGDWARDSILSAIQKGIIPQDVQFNYNGSVTRAEFCRMSIRFIEYATASPIAAIIESKGLAVKPNAFIDTGDPDILAAYTLGITNGTSAPTDTAPGEFTPNGLINREQAATILRNVCRVIGMDVENAPSSNFTDTDRIAIWAIDAVDFCYANGIMNGTGYNYFNPKWSLSRQQSVVTFERVSVKLSTG